MGNKTVRNDNMGLWDISIVRPNKEKPEVAAFKSFKISFYNNITITLNQLFMTMNLILLGHTTFDEKVNYDLIMTFQIGTFILGLFGKAFTLGLMKYLFEDKEENDLYKLYIRMKTILVFLIPIFFIPISLLSYFLLEIILKYGLEIYAENMIREVYLKFLIFAPVIYFFEILFFLNIKFLNCLKCYKTVFFYVFFYIISHITLCWILLYILEIGLIGLTISYGCNSFLFYFFTCRSIKKFGNYTEQNLYFYLIPYKENFDGEVFNTFKKNSIISLINFGDIITFLILFIASLFISKSQLILNIIYINFYELVCAINKGFYFNLKNYITETIEDSENKQKYVASYVFYYMIMEISIFLILLIFKNILLDIYLLDITKDLLKIASGVIRIFFPISLLISSIRMILNGIVRGMSVALHVKKKATYVIAYLFLCWFLCFHWKLYISGLWISLLIFDSLLLVESIHKAYVILPRFFHNI